MVGGFEQWFLIEDILFPLYIMTLKNTFLMNKSLILAIIFSALITEGYSLKIVENFKLNQDFFFISGFESSKKKIVIFKKNISEEKKITIKNNFESQFENLNGNNIKVYRKKSSLVSEIEVWSCNKQVDNFDYKMDPADGIMGNEDLSNSLNVIPSRTNFFVCRPCDSLLSYQSNKGVDYFITERLNLSSGPFSKLTIKDRFEENFSKQIFLGVSADSVSACGRNCCPGCQMKYYIKPTFEVQGKYILSSYIEAIYHSIFVKSKVFVSQATFQIDSTNNSFFNYIIGDLKNSNLLILCEEYEEQNIKSFPSSYNWEKNILTVTSINSDKTSFIKQNNKYLFDLGIPINNNNYSNALARLVSYLILNSTINLDKISILNSSKVKSLPNFSERIKNSKILDL